MLGVLREIDGHATAMDLLPGKGELSELLDEARDAGLTVELESDDDQRDLSPALALTVYRIVQESLSNAATHAVRARVIVRLRVVGDLVVVSVIDDGGDRVAPSPVADPDRSGFGLVGMRERVAVFGGSLDAGPCDSGGFHVEARLPVQGGLT
jgi:signal transduction histidine kinase